MRNELTGNTQSIYRNALPIYKNRPDLCEADEKSNEFAELFIRQSFFGQQTSVLSGTSLSQSKLQHLFIETRNLFRIEGQQTFGVGFPLFILPTDEELIVAPLFIKSLRLEPDPYQENLWTIGQTGTGRIEINEYLLDLWKKNPEFDAEDLFRSLPETLDFSPVKVQEFCQALSDKHDWQQYGNVQTLLPAPGIDVISAVPEAGGLHWSAVLGIYPVQNKNPKEEIEDWSQQFEPQVLPPAAESHPFGLLPLTPAQASCFHALREQKNILIGDSSDENRAHVLTHLLTNILSNGQKCLVVSDKAEALSNSQKQLSKTGFQRFHHLIKDTRHDTGNFLTILQSVAAAEPVLPDFNQVEYDVLLNKCKRLHSRLSAQYTATRESVFGNENRIELAGRYLRCRRRQDFELLNAHLRANDFAFNPEEYKDLKNSILISHVLYENVNTLTHPLSNLHPHVFTERKQAQGLEFTENRCQYFIGRFKDLQREFIRKTNSYRARLKEYYDLYYREFAYRVRKLREQITDNTRRYGQAFSDSGKGSLKLKSVFSSKQKEILHLRREIESDYRSLKKAFAERQYFDFAFTDSGSDISIQEIKANTDAFTQALNTGREGIADQINEEVKRLNAKNAKAKLKFDSVFADLEKAQDALLEELNGTQLYAEDFEHKMLTLDMRRQYTEGVIEQFEITLRNLRDFPVFHKWQRNWLNLNVQAQKVITALAKVQPTDWTPAFEAWYFQEAVNSSGSKDMPLDDSDLLKYTELRKELQTFLPTQINALQIEKQRVAIKALRKNDRETYRMLFSKSAAASKSNRAFSDLTGSGLNTISDIFPVMFLSLQAARELSKTVENSELFDYIIFLQSDHLRPEEAAPISRLGKRTTVFANSFLEQTGSLSEFLKIQKAPGMLIAPQQQATKGSGPSKDFGANLYLVNTEGHFKDKSGTNESEITSISQLLQEIEFTPERTLPAVGVVTFTKAQRDAVASHLLKIKQSNSEEGEKIRQLERNGMGVFFIEEVIGQQFDIFIVSFTFGMTGQKGRPGKRIKYLKGERGLQSIKYLLSKADHEMYLINSMNAKLLDEFSETENGSGAYYAANFIKFVRAAELKDEIEKHYRREILWGVNEKEKKESSLFAQEVRRILQRFFPQGRVLQYFKHEDIEIPLAVAPAEAGKAATWLQAGGFLAKTPSTCFMWEMRERKRIEEKNIHFEPVYSSVWCENTDLAAGKTAARIIKTL